MTRWSLLCLLLAVALAAVATARPSTPKSQKFKTNSAYFYPPALPRPPMLWVEGFAMRLHAGLLRNSRHWGDSSSSLTSPTVLVLAAPWPCTCFSGL